MEPGLKEKLKSIFLDSVRILNRIPFADVIGAASIISLIYHIFAVIYFKISDQFSHLERPTFARYNAAGVLSHLGLSHLNWNPLPNKPFFTSPKMINIQRATLQLISSITCFILFRQQEFWPSFLGGSGSAMGIYEGFPSLPAIPYSGGFIWAQFWCLFYIRFLERRGMTELIITLSIGIFMMNSIRLLLVLSFIFNVCNAWSNIDSIFCGVEVENRDMLKVVSWSINLGIHAFLNVITLGIIIWNIRVALESCESWVLWLEMVNLGLTLSFCSFHSQRGMIDELKLRLRMKRENENAARRRII